MKETLAPRFMSDKDDPPCKRFVRQILKNIFPFILLLGLLTPTRSNAQSGFCIFSDALQQMLDDHPEVIQILEGNEGVIQNAMHGNPQAIMNNTVYAIPVVFHVIHLGESVGNGSNISDALLLQGLDDLNYYFRDVLNTGTDVKIEFCLAERDPTGAPSTGINRVNGYGVGNYHNIGIAPGNNEVGVKALSIWPSADYLNIWVVHEIAGGSILGYAYFPGAPAALDGIVMRYDAIGVSGNSGVIVHEAGHYLNLFHTFEGGSTTTCPSNGDCAQEGDKVCDTPPHKLVYGGCNSAGTNDCDNNSSNALVVHNHMNYTDNSCRNEFTPDQVMRMRSAYMLLRPRLMYSLGCEPGCTTTVADFTVSPDLEVPVNTTVSFTNTSTNATSYVWRIDGSEIATTTDLSYIFSMGGTFEVCLDATGDCTDRKCVTISVYPSCEPPDTCEKVVNGDFERITSLASSSIDLTPVCGWMTTYSSPYFCNKPDNNAIGLWINPFDEERVTSEDTLCISMILLKDCTVSFDYLVTNKSVESILLAMTETNAWGTLPNDAIIIAQVDDPAVDYTGQVNHECYKDNVNFHKYIGTFTFTDDGKKYLNISGKSISSSPSDYAIVFVDNVSINCCECTTCCTPVPDFDYDLEDCSVTFTGYNTGDPGVYIWDFGDGTTGTGQVVTHDYIFGGIFTVCLTILCGDLETSATICKEIEIPDNCNECEGLDPVTATLCETSEQGPNKYLANFCFQVPKGYNACKPGKLYVASPDVNVVVESYEIDESNVSYDEVCVAISVTLPNGFSASYALGRVVLCDEEGNMICREFRILPSVCDNCLDKVHTMAPCNDPNLTDNIYIYEGQVTFTLLSGAVPCGWNSPLVGFEVLSANAPPGSPNQTWTVNYRITTTNNKLMHTTALLCFEIVGVTYCIPLDITIIPCRLPEDCVAAWTPKNMTCTSTENGEYVFNIQKQVYAGPYSLCAGGLFGTVDGGGYVTINGTPTTNFGVFTFNIDIRIPTNEFDNCTTYNLKLYLCDHLGNIVCYHFPFVLCCGTGTGGGGGIGGGGLTDGSMDDRIAPISGTSSTYRIVPNPANDKILIATHDVDPAKQRELRLMDHTGRLVQVVRLTADAEIVQVAHLPPGIYMAVVVEDGRPVQTEKIAIVR